MEILTVTSWLVMWTATVAIAQYVLVVCRTLSFTSLARVMVMMVMVMCRLLLLLLERG